LLLQEVNPKPCRDKRTRDFAAGKKVKVLLASNAAGLKLDCMEAAVNIQDLMALPGNRSETQKGRHKAHQSIHINDQWRICSEWLAGTIDSSDVEIVAYHQMMKFIERSGGSKHRTRRSAGGL